MVVDGRSSSYRQGGLKLFGELGIIEMSLRSVGRIGLLPIVLGAMACSDMDPGNDTFSVVYPNLANQGGSAGDDATGNAGTAGTAGTAGSGGTSSMPSEFPPAWSCLDTPPPKFTLPNPAPTTVNYVVPIIDFILATPVPGIQVKLCLTIDCVDDVPIPAPVQPDPSRPVLYLLQLPYNANQLPYLQLSADGYVTMDYYFGGPIVGNPNPDPDNNPDTPPPTFLGNVIPMLRTEILNDLLTDVGSPVPLDPGRGVIAARTLDCTNQRAAGVFVESLQEMGPDTFPWSLSNNNVAYPGLLPTDARGVAGFANVPEGPFRVRGVAPAGGDDGTRYGDHTLRVKANVITLGEVRMGIGDYGQ